MVFFLLTKFGAITLTRWLTRIGRRNCDVRLHSLACSDRHGSIIQRPDGLTILVNHSFEAPIYINNFYLEPGQSIALSSGDVICFSGDESFKFVESDQLPTVLIISSPRLSPD